jgi:septal ring factor EnvC (AmiA/AmiB activator)
MAGSRASWLGLALAAGFVVRPPAAAGQDVDRQIRANQARLDSIRREREQLESELSRLRGRAHSLATELANVERQVQTTSRLVNELDRQIGALGGSLDTVTLELALTEDALAEKRAILQRRVAEIYKRGPLWSFQVMLAAESFGDLVSRYKYLYLVSRQDRALVGAIEELRRRIAAERRQLLRIRTELAARREERATELSRYVSLEQRYQRSLRETRASERAAAARVDSLARAAERLNQLIAALERARRRSPGGGAGPSSITPSDLGKLDWPASGELVYRFGTQRLPNNTTIRQNGIGIRTPAGTPVRAVAAGAVALARPLNTYGPTVMLDHGGGFYTLYLYLSKLSVREGQHLEAGEVVGLSGGESSPEGPHLEFQIRGQGGIALDPLNWLKPRPEAQPQR